MMTSVFAIYLCSEEWIIPIRADGRAHVITLDLSQSKYQGI